MVATINLSCVFQDFLEIAVYLSNNLIIAVASVIVLPPPNRVHWINIFGFTGEIYC